MNDQAFDPKELLEQAASRFDVFGREVRTVKSGPIEVRADDDGDHLVGHAAVFNRETVIGRWFREQVAPGAFKKTIKEADVRHLFNHDPNMVLARTKNGTLDLSEDDFGLAYDALLNPDDPDAIRVKAKVERGDVTQSSFGFIVVADEWEEGEIHDDGTKTLPLRTIKEAKLFDTSTVTYPAYTDADAMIRMAGLDLLTRSLGVDEARVPDLLMALADEENEDTDLSQVFQNIAARAAELAATDDEEDDETRADDESPEDEEERQADDESPEAEIDLQEMHAALLRLTEIVVNLRDSLRVVDTEEEDEVDVIEEDTRKDEADEIYIRFHDRRNKYLASLVKE